MGGVGAEPWGRVPGPAVCGRRAGDSCPEWRLRSRSRGRGQWLSDGPRRRPQLLTGEGADLGLGDPGDVGVAKAGGPGVRGLGQLRAHRLFCRRAAGTRALQGARCPRPSYEGRPAPEPGEGRAGSDWVPPPGGGVSEPAQPPSTGDITDQPPPPEPPLLSPSSARRFFCPGGARLCPAPPRASAGEEAPCQ